MKLSKIITMVGLLFITAIPLCSFAQYFNVLHDFDSTQDFGWNVFLQPDSGNNYLIFGSPQDSTGYAGLMYMTIAADGSSVIHRHLIIASDSSDYYLGLAAAIKKLENGGYIIPLTVQINNTSGVLRSTSGIIRLNTSLDTEFVKVYTDTSIYFDVLWNLALMPDGGFLLGGYRQGNTVATSVGLLMRIDSVGDTLWSRTYTYDPTKSCEINTIEALNNGNILAGAMSTTPFMVGADEFDDNQPWFLILDSVGNILRDTLYGQRYGGGEYLCRH